MPKPFVPAGTRSHYPPDRLVTVDHLAADLEIDLAGRTVAGVVRIDATVRAPELEALTLDAVDMEIVRVAVGDSTAPHDYDGERLRVELGRAYAAGERLSLSVRYRCAPRRGLYFLAPDESDPQRPVQCWTQGQDEDARHFIPCLDAPNQKPTTEVVCTAPGGTFVLSNGELRDRKVLDDGRVRWHYLLELPQASYLITLVCGTFAEVKERAPETGVDVHYFVPPGREEDARRSLGRTPEMIDLFSRKIGVRYPHARYSQIVVADFIFGGMENTTATTLTDLALMDRRAAIDHDMEALVAHELAHQWWGDLVTCREWPEAWLNEGFATYFEYVWREHARGRDEADIELLVDIDTYLGEASRYQRPIVCRQYDQPIELFDAHLYEKGGRVLHMLRDQLGDDAFWKALRLYAERHGRGSAETRDLARAVEEVSGRNFDAFFEQWVGAPGHPELEASWEWDADRKFGTLRVEQKQDADRVYRLPLRVRFEVDGREQDEVLRLTERSHAFELRLPGKPAQVVVDPGDVLLKAIKVEKPRPLWIRQLERARLAVDRVLAARALGEKAEPEAVAALRRALGGDPVWAVRAAAATALGKTRRADALEALLAARRQEHPKVRRAVAAALGDFRDDDRAAEALARWIEQGDASYFVEANAAYALGRTRSPRALAVLPGLLERASFQDVVRTRAIDGLAATSAEEALPLVIGAYRPELSFQARRAAVSGAARLGEGTAGARRAREFLERCLVDRDFRVRAEAALSLASLGDTRALAAIEHALAVELDGRARRRMRQALTELREGSRAPEKVRKLEEELERLRLETGKLRERVEAVEARNPAGGGGDEGPRTRGGGGAKRPRPRIRRGAASKPLAPRRRR